MDWYCLHFAPASAKLCLPDASVTASVVVHWPAAQEYCPAVSQVSITVLDAPDIRL